MAAGEGAAAEMEAVAVAGVAAAGAGDTLRGRPASPRVGLARRRGRRTHFYLVGCI